MNNNFFAFISLIMIHHIINYILNLIIVILSYRYTKIWPVSPLLFNIIFIIKLIIIKVKYFKNTKLKMHK